MRSEKALRASPEVVQALHERQLNPNQLIAVGPNPYGSGRRINAAVVEVQSASYGWLYWNSPAVRTVVDFIARNVSQLALRLYERTSDIERHQVSDHAAAQSVRNPNNQTPGEQFIFDITASWLVYHNSYVLKFRPDIGDTISLLPLPSNMVGVIGQNRFIAEGYRVWRTDGTWFDVPPEDMIHWRAYNPEDARKGVSPLETLRKTLAEDVASQTANLELMQAGLAQPGWIGRSLDAPNWSEEARNRFEEDWANRARAANRKTPVLEEGMEFHDFGVSPKDAEMLAGRRFTVEQVASLYGVPLGLLGLGSLASLEEQHAQFYADVLPPITEMLASYLDLSILSAEYDEPKLYFEFNLDEKRMGNERLTALTSASGAPVMTRNESRAMLNLPPKEGGDELVTPLNVTVGGKPSPQVMPIQDPNKPAQDGSARNASMNGKGKAHLIARREGQRQRRERYASEFSATLLKVFAEMERSTRSKGTKDFDPARWIKRLTAALLSLMKLTVEREGGVAASRFGLPDFDMGQVEHYLEATAEGKAQQIVATIEADLAEGSSTEVFANAKDVQAHGIGETLATHMSNFAQTEAGKQTPDAEHRLKRWIVEDLDTSAHPEMAHEMVRLSEQFSNGKQYPPYEHPACRCMVEIT